MLNQSAQHIEGIDFLNSFVEYLEELPTELTRVCTNVRELDIKTYNIMHEVNNIYPQINLLPIGDPKRSKLSTRLQQLLINMQDNCDEKIRHTSMLNEMIETKHKLLSDNRNEPLTDISNIKQERERAQSPVIQIPQNQITTQSTSSSSFVNVPQKAPSYDSSGNANSNNMSGNNSDSKNTDRASKRPRRARADTGIDVDNETNIKIEIQVNKQPHIPQNSANLKRTSSGSSNKKKKKKVGKQTSNQINQTSTREQVVPDLLPQEEAIDPDEPTYCLCEQISFGEMIMCDNDLCPIEWFHFSCVSLMTKPKGKWYCPNCRGDRPNIMKNKNQFMKELERYNKEKLSN